MVKKMKTKITMETMTKITLLNKDRWFMAHLEQQETRQITVEVKVNQEESSNKYLRTKVSPHRYLLRLQFLETIL